MEKVAIINSFLDYGSTGSITRQLYDYGLAQGYEPYVFYGRYSAGDNEHLFRIGSRWDSGRMKSSAHLFHHIASLSIIMFTIGW